MCFASAWSRNSWNANGETANSMGFGAFNITRVVIICATTPNAPRVKPKRRPPNGWNLNVALVFEFTQQTGADVAFYTTKCHFTCISNVLLACRVVRCDLCHRNHLQHLNHISASLVRLSKDRRCRRTNRMCAKCITCMSLAIRNISVGRFKWKFSVPVMRILLHVLTHAITTVVPSQNKKKSRVKMLHTCPQSMRHVLRAIPFIHWIVFHHKKQFPICCLDTDFPLLCDADASTPHRIHSNRSAQWTVVDGNHVHYVKYYYVTREIFVRNEWEAASSIAAHRDRMLSSIEHTMPWAHTSITKNLISFINQLRVILPRWQ